VRGYAFSEHTADVVVEAWGETIEEAFEEAARGMYAVMTETELVRPEVEHCVEVAGFDLENLLYRWLEELLVATDSEGLVFSDFTVHAVEKRGSDFYLRGCARGERFDRERHRSKTGVKAVTYHLMRICEEGGSWKVRYTLDI